MRWLKWIVILAIFGGIGYGVYYYKFRNQQTAEEKPEIVTVTRQDITIAVNSNGKVQSNLDVEIKSKASGTVMRVPFEVSDRVADGDLLVELDPVDEQRRVTQAESSMLSAEAKLLKAKEALRIAEYDLKVAGQKTVTDSAAAASRVRTQMLKTEREKELYDKKLTSREEYETARNAADQAQADYDNAVTKVAELKSQELALEVKRQDIRQAENDYENSRLNLEDAQKRLAETKIYSPMDGVVTDRQVQVGQIVSSGISNVGGGTTLMVISDLSRVFISAAVDESEIGKVKIGQPVRITVDAHPNKKINGTVSQIAARGTNAQNVVTFEVKIEVADKQMGLLKPEMTANVDIIIAERKNVLTIPVEAVNTRTPGHPATSRAALPGSDSQAIDGTSMVVKAGAGQPTPIELGLSDGFLTEVISGLAEGDELIISKQDFKSKWSKPEANQKNDRAVRDAARMMGGPPRR